MPDNSYTQVSQSNWFSRIGTSFKGMGFGLLLLALATGLLYWNEGRAVRTGDAIGEAQRVAVALPSAAAIDPAFNGKLVHVSGQAATKDMVSDPLFGVAANAISLVRKVQYYQWVEKSKSETQQKMGGGEETITTYTYEQKWVDKPVDSQDFNQPQRYRNSVNLQTEKGQWYAALVQLGAYRLPEFLLRSMSGAVPQDTGLSEAEQEALHHKLFPDSSLAASAVSAPGYRHNRAYAAAGQEQDRSPMVQVRGNTLYLGRDMDKPNIGDVMVSFFVVPQAEVSIIAQVIGDTFEPFRAANGTSFSSLRMGVLGMDNMFEDAKKANTTLTWILRVIGILLAIGGLKMLIAPLQVLASVVPLLGRIVGAGSGLVASLLGLSWSCLIIALAWLRFRPMLALGLLAVAVVLVALLFFKGKKSAVKLETGV